jgi:hypothetical protein
MIFGEIWQKRPAKAGSNQGIDANRQRIFEKVNLPSPEAAITDAGSS